MAATAKKPKVIVRTPLFRADYPKVFQPDQKYQRYSVNMIFDKDTDVKEFVGKINEVIRANFGANPPASLKKPLKKGMIEKKTGKPVERYDGLINGKAGSKFQPEVVDARKQKITDPKEIYAGCYCYAMVELAPHEDGVSLRLLALQKVKDGEPFYERQSVSAYFDEHEADLDSLDIPEDSADDDDLFN